MDNAFNFQVIPLNMIPVTAIVNNDKYSQLLIQIKQEANRIHGYFLLKDVGTKGIRYPATFKLQKVETMKWDPTGDWFLGRIHLLGSSGYQISVSINDPLIEEPIRRCVMNQIRYSDTSLKAAITKMQEHGSDYIFGEARDFGWKCRISPEFEKFAALDAFRIPAIQAS